MKEHGSAAKKNPKAAQSVAQALVPVLDFTARHVYLRRGCSCRLEEKPFFRLHHAPRRDPELRIPN